MFITSRPAEENGELTPQSFDFEELQLIAAFMHHTRLGKGSVYKQAAFSILNKLTDYFDDEDFSQQASDDVMLEVRMLDDQGNFQGILNDFEFEP